MKMILVGRRRYWANPATSPSTRISKREASGLSETSMFSAMPILGRSLPTRPESRSGGAGGGAVLLPQLRLGRNLDLVDMPPHRLDEQEQGEPQCRDDEEPHQAGADLT